MRGPPTSDDEKPKVWGSVPPGSEALGGPVDFSDYVWMGEEMEEFDNKCLLELCEEEFIAQCFEEMFAEEDQFLEEVNDYLAELSAEEVEFLVQQMDAVAVGGGGGLQSAPVIQYNVAHRIRLPLNPNAPEFIPNSPSHPSPPTSPPSPSGSDAGEK